MPAYEQLAEGEGVWLGVGGVATTVRGTSCCGRAQGSLFDRRLLKPREPWSYWGMIHARCFLIRIASEQHSCKALQVTMDAAITRSVSYFEHLERTDSTGTISLLLHAILSYRRVAVVGRCPLT